MILQSFTERSRTRSLLVSEKEFIPHITLARIKSWEFRKMPLASIPEVDEEINLSIPVSSFVLMESKLEKGGPVYEVISKFELYEGE